MNHKSPRRVSWVDFPTLRDTMPPPKSLSKQTLNALKTGLVYTNTINPDTPLTLDNQIAAQARDKNEYNKNNGKNENKCCFTKLRIALKCNKHPYYPSWVRQINPQDHTTLLKY